MDAGPSGRPAAGDLRQLLRHVLEDFQSRGGRLHIPIGCHGLEDWLMDAISVPDLLQKLSAGAKDITLLQVCKSKSTTPSQRNLQTNGDPPIISMAELLSRSSGDVRGSGLPASAQEVDANEPVLDLPQLRTGLEEHQLKELAYTVFVGCCSQSGDADLLKVMQGQLEMNDSRAAEVQRILATAASWDGAAPASAVATLEMHVKLLQRVRPANFDSFRNFVRWRDTVSSVVLQILTQAVQDPDNARNSSQARHMLARLRGGMRRISVRDADEYDEAEYTEATSTVFEAAAAIASLSSSGWQFPWGLRVRLADLMLRGMFDVLDEGTFIAEKDALLQLLQTRVWPVLGIQPHIHSTIFAWIHFRQFAVTGNQDLLEATTFLIQGIANSPKRSGQGSSLADAAADEEFGVEVAAAIEHWIVLRMSDYHQNFGDPELMHGLVEVLVVAEQSKGADAAVPQVLEACIRSSMEAAYLRLVSTAATEGADDAKNIIAIAKATGALFTFELATYSPLLAPHLPTANQAAARRLHGCFGSDLLTWLLEVKDLAGSTLDAVREADALEVRLLEHVPGGLGDTKPWGTMQLLSPLLYKWVSGQLALLTAWSDRIFETEDWKAVTQPRGCARSAVEVISIAREAIEGLFGMKLPLQVDLVRALTEGIDGVLSRYATLIVEKVGSTDVLIPPPPTLTRYKRELALKAEMEASGDSPRSVRHKPSLSDESLAAFAGDEARLKALTAATLVVRLNSLQYVADHLPDMEKMVQERWQATVPTSARRADGSLGQQDWLFGMFEGAQQSVQHAIEAITQFTGTKVIFYDIRKPILEDLYKHRVDKARIGPVLELMDSALGNMAAETHPEVQPQLIRTMLEAAITAISRVLLDGGPYRFFIPDDTELIEQDLEELNVMFHADGDGLPREEITEALGPISELLTVLGLETGILISNLKQARAAEKSGVSPPGTGSSRLLVYDADVLQHVLAHRADRVASKFLKKEFRMPKKAGGSTGFANGFSSGLSKWRTKIKQKM
ncbi:hypothetical protein WJX72_007612 [[Myrmecia] bisecta]|uniref:Uncharacterized protein n=1 Tax=[Myrmecia] bisecta TaxID=41462 RepID=A0AAW1R7C5_9CHLO